MKPIRKPFFGDPKFPFNLVYKTIRTPQFELPNHLHDRLEFVYIHKGQGTFFIDNTLYEKKTGDLFIIPGNTIHRSFPNTKDPIISSALFFAPIFVQTLSLHESDATLKCYELAKKKKRYKIQMNDFLQETVITLLHQINEEMHQQQFGYREAVHLLLCQLLLQVNRTTLSIEQQQPTEMLIGPPWISEALRFIDTNPSSSQLGLAELAEQASVTSSHFSRVFKQLTGMNVTDYINAKRLVIAKELLLTQQYTIAHIAEQCGYTSLPHFYRVFKSLTGLTPRSYQYKLD